MIGISKPHGGNQYHWRSLCSRKLIYQQWVKDIAEFGEYSGMHTYATEKTRGANKGDPNGCLYVSTEYWHGKTNGMHRPRPKENANSSNMATSLTVRGLSVHQQHQLCIHQWCIHQ